MKMPALAVLALTGGCALFSESFLYTAETPAPANQLVVRADQGRVTINRNIYGHFSEHLGRCIYEGFWVEPDSPIPNLRGIRNDVVEALKKSQHPRAALAGRVLCRRVPLEGRHRAPQRAADHDQHPLGRRDREQPLRHPRVPRPVRAARLRALHLRQRGQRHGAGMQEWVEYITFDGVSPMADLRKKNGRAAPWQVKYWGVGNENWGCGGNMTPRVLCRPVQALRHLRAQLRRQPRLSRSPAAPTATTTTGPRC